jgi:hypothetical protein
MTSAIRSLVANDLHGKVTSYNPKCIFGSSSSSASEPGVPEPEVFEHRTRGTGRERVWQRQPQWLLREA